jgi:hypothetical protein
MPGPYREGSVWSRNSPSLLPAKRNAPHAPRRTRRETERYPAMIRQMTSRPLNCRSTDLFQSEIRKSGKEKGRYQGVGTGRNRHSQNQTGHPGTSGTMVRSYTCRVVAPPRAQDRTPVPNFSPPTSTKCRQWLYPSWCSLIRCNVRLALASALPLSWKPAFEGCLLQLNIIVISSAQLMAEAPQKGPTLKFKK